MLALAAEFTRHGVAFSPHNPSGPVCYAQSLHVCAALAESDLLEVQFDETPVFDTLAGQSPPRLDAGGVPVPVADSGLGIAPCVEKHAATLHFSTGNIAR